jgi:hypothetical protein
MYEGQVGRLSGPNHSVVWTIRFGVEDGSS